MRNAILFHNMDFRPAWPAPVGRFAQDPEMTLAAANRHAESACKRVRDGQPGAAGET
jgi:hypothetical protein